MSHMKDAYPIGHGIVLYPKQDQAIDQQLKLLFETTSAAFVVLCGQNGQFISAQGNFANVDLVAIGSLVASDIAASQQIAKLVGESEAHQVILREGSANNLFIAAAGEFLVLLALISKKEPIGWGRIQVQKTANTLNKIVGQPSEQTNKTTAIIEKNADVDHLLDMALGDLWSE